MKDAANIAAWLDTAPQEVRDTTARLLDEVDAMRATETIYPAQDDVLNALAHTAPKDVRAVIIGQDPYHEEGQAMGLSFSVPRGQKLPPSLKNVYHEMVRDLGCVEPATGDLTPWADHGVLLLNTTLTVREHAAASHSKLGWQTLTGYVIRRCCDLEQPIVFLAWGRHAIDLAESAMSEGAHAQNKCVLKSTHPSPLSARRNAGELHAFMGSAPFSTANAFLSEQGAEPIPWDCLG